MDHYQAYSAYLRGLPYEAVRRGRDLLRAWLDQPEAAYGTDREMEEVDRCRLAWHNAELARRIWPVGYYFLSPGRPHALCRYCGAVKGEFCGMASAYIYRGGVCPNMPSAHQT